MKIVLTLILAVGLGLGAFYLMKHSEGGSQPSPVASRPSTAIVEPRDINFAVTVAGEIAPAEQVSVRPEINGKISTLNVDVSDKVKQGDVLFTLDDKELQNQKSASLADVDRAKLQLEQAERDFRRNQQLFEDKLVSQEIYDNSRTAVALAKNALERANRDLAVLDEKLSKTVIMAPFDCTVLVRPVSIGQAVSGSGGVGGGTEVLVIADLNQMIINAHVNQADVTRLKLKQEVEVDVEAVIGLSVTGMVERIAPQATIKNNIKGFATRIAIKDIDPRIQPGMTANITIPVASADNVLAVPLGAVFSEQGDRFVYVKAGDQFERRPIEIGLADYFHAEVVSGLKAGEVVSLEQPPPEAIKANATPANPNRGTNASLTAAQGGLLTSQVGGAKPSLATGGAR